MPSTENAIEHALFMLGFMKLEDVAQYIIAHLKNLDNSNKLATMTAQFIISLITFNNMNNVCAMFRDSLYYMPSSDRSTSDIYVQQLYKIYKKYHWSKLSRKFKKDVTVTDLVKDILPILKDIVTHKLPQSKPRNDRGVVTTTPLQPIEMMDPGSKEACIEYLDMLLSIEDDKVYESVGGYRLSNHIVGLLTTKYYMSISDYDVIDRLMALCVSNGRCRVMESLSEMVQVLNIQSTYQENYLTSTRSDPVDTDDIFIPIDMDDMSDLVSLASNGADVETIRSIMECSYDGSSHHQQILEQAIDVAASLNNDVLELLCEYSY